MNYSICKKITTSLLILLSTSNYLFAHDECAQTTTATQDLPASYAQFEREMCEEKLKKILLQFNQVDSILEDLSLVVNNDQLKQITNKRIVNEGIKEIRSMIDLINKETFATIDPMNIVLLNNQLADLIALVNDAVIHNFSGQTIFDMSVCTNMNRILEQGPAEQDFDFDAQSADLDKKITALDDQAKNVGLKWHNKTYRKLNDYVIQPSIKYRVPQRLAMASIVAAAATYCWWRTDRGTKSEENPLNYKLVPAINPETSLPIIDNKGEVLTKLQLVAPNKQTIYYGWEEKLRNILGHYRHTDNSVGNMDKLDDNSFHANGRNPVKVLGEIEKKIFDFQHGLMPLGAILLGQKYLYDNEAGKAYNWCRNKVITAHNNLLGGAYVSRKTTNDNGMIGMKEPRITFDDIVGMEHAKDVLSLIVKYIQDPERWDRGRLTPEKGYLLTGPTRTGKSYMAEALCGEIKRALKEQNRNPDEFGFYEISATLIEEKGMDTVMNAFKSVAPCVLFIDEIDLLRLQRAGGNSTLLNQFLVSMSGAIDSDPKKQVIVLAATNKPENMDEALKQPGRFGKEIRFDYPNLKYRKSYLTNRLNPLCVNIEAFNLDKIALETAGCSFEQLNTIIKVAFSKAKIFGHTLTHELLEKALDSEIRLIRLDEGKDLPETEKVVLSVHQAGHTLATMLLNTTHEVSKVTIRPVQTKLKEKSTWDDLYTKEADKQKPIEYGKLFIHQKNDTLNINSKEEMINMCKIQLAGHIAEEVLNGSSGYTYHEKDSEHALHIATAIVCEGLRMENLSKPIQNEMSDKAFRLLNTCKDEMRALFIEHKDTLEAIARELQKNLTLTAQEIEIIMQTGTLPDAAATKSTDAAAMASELGINEELPTA